uniref:Uncharacterized protein n=1 Tax=Oryza barthii TaxID=65489 RepID=A0A0D3GN15_9ORYZ
MFFNTHVRATVSLSGMMRNTVKRWTQNIKAMLRTLLCHLKRMKLKPTALGEPLLERLSMAPPVLKLY